MARIFDPAFVEKRDFHHARYGLGAVVVAVPKGPDPETTEKRRSRGLHAARLFTERRSPVKPRFILTPATIERVIPFNRV